RQSNSLTVNFATVQEGVLCYTDLIKVSVSLADGSLTGFEAHGYTVNHHTRTLARPTVNAGTASAHVTPSLSILAHQLTLIPSAGEHEVLCHEFKCEAEDGSHVVVYVNALTDAQEKILILLEDENGTLAM
ncbi:MAG: germination protein YpeB, partial [Clostridiales bacterium]|nr:germination protein YpeB [Clostridiales bacterium]